MRESGALEASLRGEGRWPLGRRLRALRAPLGRRSGVARRSRTARARSAHCSGAVGAARASPGRRGQLAGCGRASLHICTWVESHSTSRPRHSQAELAVRSERVLALMSCREPCWGFAKARRPSRRPLRSSGSNVDAYAALSADPAAALFVCAPLAPIASRFACPFREALASRIFIQVPFVRAVLQASARPTEHLGAPAVCEERARGPKLALLQPPFVCQEQVGNSITGGHLLT